MTGAPPRPALWEGAQRIRRDRRPRAASATDDIVLDMRSAASAAMSRPAAT